MSRRCIAVNVRPRARSMVFKNAIPGNVCRNRRVFNQRSRQLFRATRNRGVLLNRGNSLAFLLRASLNGGFQVASGRCTIVAICLIGAGHGWFSDKQLRGVGRVVSQGANHQVAIGAGLKIGFIVIERIGNARLQTSQAAMEFPSLFIGGIRCQTKASKVSQ